MVRPMNPGDFMGIGSVAQANAALRGLDDELEEARRRLDELKRQRETFELYEIAD